MKCYIDKLRECPLGLLKKRLARAVAELIWCASEHLKPNIRTEK